MTPHTQRKQHRSGRDEKPGSECCVSSLRVYPQQEGALCHLLAPRGQPGFIEYTRTSNFTSETHRMTGIEIVADAPLHAPGESDF